MYYERAGSGRTVADVVCCFGRDAAGGDAEGLLGSRWRAAESFLGGVLALGDARGQGYQERGSGRNCLIVLMWVVACSCQLC